MSRRTTVLVAAVLAAAVAALVALLVPYGGAGGSGSPAGTAGPVSPGSGPVTGGDTVLGMNLNRVFNDAPFDDTRAGPLLRSARDAGIRDARSDLFWEATERQAPVGGRHAYDWRFGDWVAGRLAANGIRWLPILDYAPPWASGVPAPRKAPPRDAADYAAFAAAAARRYGPNGTLWRARPDLPALPVRTWEIWNEPNSTHFWGGRPDAARYAELYARARAAIHAVDPGATVLVGGLTPAYDSYVDDMVLARPELRRAIDGVAIHPYGPNVAAGLDGVRKRRAALRALGMDLVPLYVTEYGWVTRPPGADHFESEAQRAADLPAMASALARSDCGVAAIYPYTWTTPERNPAAEEDWYGIVHPDGRLSPSAEAWRRLVRGGVRGAPVLLCGG